MKPRSVFHKPRFGAPGGDTVEDKAVKAIKAMCRHAISVSVMDDAAAIDGSRPLEEVVDALYNKCELPSKLIFFVFLTFVNLILLNYILQEEFL